MTVLVNLGYGSITDGWSQGPANVLTPFDPFPSDLNWSDVLTALVNGVPQGIQAAIADLESPDNYQIPSLLDNPTLAPLLPIEDTINALTTALPAFDASLFTDQLEAGNLLGAIGDPIAADVALIVDAVEGTLLNIVDLIP
jgi:hypothetical protein